MPSPKSLQTEQYFNSPQMAVSKYLRTHKFINKSKRLLCLILLILFVAAINSVAINTQRAYATEFINDYPNQGAMDYNPSAYEWWVDEDGDGNQDIINDPNYNDERMSSRGYYYKNCTDGVSYWVKKYTGVNVSGWGNADTWDTAAASANYAVYNGNSNNIEPGDIAQSDDSGWGHVGFVTSVNKYANGAIISITVAELNRKGDGLYSMPTYSSKNALGNFIRYGADDWDHFIDVNGVNRGLNNEELTANNPNPPTDIRVPVVGNFDGQNGQDLLASSKRADSAPNLLNFPSTGNWLGANSLWGAPGQIRWADARLAAGDLDKDGKTDLFAIQSQSDGHPNIFWLRSQGSSFASPQLVGVPGLWFNDVKEWVSGDFTGDGHADLLAVSKRSDAAANFVVFPSTGSWLGASAIWGAPGELKWSEVKVIPADLDNDGKTDLLSVQPNANGSPAIYWSRSNGSSFEAPKLVGVPGLTFSHINNWIAGNFDGRLGTDLLVSSKRGDTAPNLLVFPSTGGWLGANSLWGAPGQINWANAKMVPADLDGDGKTDLLSIQPDGNNNPNIWWSKSTGSSFATPQLVGVPGLIFTDQRWQS